MQDSLVKIGLIKCVIEGLIVEGQQNVYQVVEINGELFAGSDAFFYPNNKGALMPLEAFEMPNEWIWIERYIIKELNYGDKKTVKSKYKVVKGEESKEIIIEILNSMETGRLCLNTDKYPYCIPMNHIYCNNRIYMHCGKKGLKQILIKKNNKVCYEIDGVEGFVPPNTRSCHLKYKSALFFGAIEDVLDEEEKYEALTAFAKHYGTNYDHGRAENTSILAIDIDYATARNCRLLDHKERILYIYHFANENM